MTGAGEGEAELHETFIDATEELWELTQESIADGEADSVNPCFMLLSVSPKERVSSIRLTNGSLVGKPLLADGSDINVIPVKFLGYKGCPSVWSRCIFSIEDGCRCSMHGV